MLYELTTLTFQTMDAEATDKVVLPILERYGATIESVDHQGVKRLAYYIREQDRAFYTMYTLRLEEDAPAKINQELNITDDVIRYLMVSVDERKLKH